jgi:hypothetical protein
MICEIIVHLLVITQNNKRCMVEALKFKKNTDIFQVSAQAALRSISPLYPNYEFTNSAAGIR